MTIAADAFPRRDPAEFTRWTICLLIVIALHCGAFLLLIRHRVPFEPVNLPSAAVIIDLPPAPAVARPEAAPPPEPIPLPPEPEPPPPEPEPAMPMVEPSPAPHPAVVLPAPPKPKPKAKPVERPPVQQSFTPIPAAPTPVAPAAPAPSTANVRATWQAQLLSWLERHKRYPRLAQEQRQQGVASLRFALDRQGRVLSFRLDKSSGYTLLDEEVLELIQRAQPVPAPPPEVSGERIEVLVPVAFSLKKAGL